uniref:Uncharacterized protein n=1 Tax=Brassica campestris TaxID=3711 RepID=M4EM98_BRACM
MDSQGWDPGDLRLQRGNRKVLSGYRRVNLHLHDGFSGGWKRKELMDSRRILWRSGKSRKERQGKSNLKSEAAGAVVSRFEGDFLSVARGAWLSFATSLGL